jgi:hypothetical protein
MRPLPVAAALAAGLVLITSCLDTTRPPAVASRAHLSVAPVFAAGAPTFDFDRVRIVVLRTSTDSLRDTTVAFSIGQPQFELDLQVHAVPNEQLTVVLQYRSSSLVLYEGGGTAIAHSTTSSGTPAQITVNPVGPGATATRVTLSPAGGTFPSTGAITVTARAFDAKSTELTGALFKWTADDASVGTVSASGVVQPTAKGGLLRVTATTMSGASGDALITFIGPPARLLIGGGGGQTGAPGQALTEQFSVVAVTATGLAVAGQTVSFGATGGGSVSPATAATDGGGVARTTMTLGSSLGSYTFTATLGSLVASVTATAASGPAAKLIVVSGDGQSDTVRKTLAKPLVVKVTDQLGNAKSGVTVNWARTSGTGSLSASASATSADGTASVSYTLGTKTGSETVVASVQGVTATASFTVTAQPGAPARMSAPAGTTITGKVGVPITGAPYVLITDQDGNPAPGVSVQGQLFSATLLLATQTLTSDANGIVSVTGVIPPASGSYSVVVSRSGLTGSPITFVVSISP